MFEHLRYWHPIFAQWLNQHEALTLHFDPRDSSRLYVAHGDDFLDVPLADLRTPAVSRWELQAATRHLREMGRRAIIQPMLIEAIDAHREIVRAAQASTRKIRRKKQIEVRRTPVAIDPLNPAPATTSGSDIDWSKPSAPFEGDGWHRRDIAMAELDHLTDEAFAIAAQDARRFDHFRSPKLHPK